MVPPPRRRGERPSAPAPRTAQRNHHLVRKPGGALWRTRFEHGLTAMMMMQCNAMRNIVKDVLVAFRAERILVNSRNGKKLWPSIVGQVVRNTRKSPKTQ